MATQGRDRAGHTGQGSEQEKFVIAAPDLAAVALVAAIAATLALWFMRGGRMP